MSEVKALGDGKIGGFGVRYTDPNHKDLQGDYFAPDTNLWLEHYPEVPLLYQHGMDGTLDTRVIGKAVAQPKDEGVWYEAQLNLRDTYENLIYELAKAGKLGYSSGSVNYLVRREPDGKLAEWPVVEMTLTPNPAAGPHLTSVSAVRSAFKSIGMEFPGGEQMGTEATKEKDTAAQAATENTQETKTAPAVDMEAVKTLIAEQVNATVSEAVTKAIEPLKKPQAKAAPFSGGGSKDPEDDKPLVARKAYKSTFGLYLRRKADETALKALGEGTNSAGGYTVPEDFRAELVKSLLDFAVIRPLARTWQTSSDTFRLPTLATRPTAAITAENAAYNESDPSFGTLSLTPYKYTLLTRVSEEVLTDSAINLQALLAELFGEAFADAQEAHFATGTGSGQPQGAVTGAGVGVTAASNAAITADELIDLYHSLGARYRSRAVFIANDTTIAALRKLKDSNGNYLLRRLGETPTDTLLGRPIYAQNDMATIGSTAKTILFGDFRYYSIVDNVSISIRRLNERFAATGQVGFIANMRTDAKVTLADAFKVLQQAV